MAKRFTDTEKWERPWFRRLPQPYRDFWMFLVDKCDAAGIWYVDMELASFLTGHDLNYEDAISFLNKQIEEIEKGAKWFLVDFIRFQYGILSEDCKPHLKIISELKDLGLYERVPHTLSHRVLNRVQEEEKDKDKDKDLLLKRDIPKFKIPSPTEVFEYAKSIGFFLNGHKFCDFYESKGWLVGKNKMRDWKAAVRNWKNTSNQTIPETDDPDRKIKLDQVNKSLRELAERSIRRPSVEVEK